MHVRVPRCHHLSALSLAFPPCAHALSALLSAVHCGPSAECRERGRYVSINSVTTSHYSYSQHAMCAPTHGCTACCTDGVASHLHYNAHGSQHTITYNNNTVSCPESTWCTRRERWIVHVSWVGDANRAWVGTGSPWHHTPRTSRVWRPCGGVELCGRRAGGGCSAARLGKGLVKGRRGEWPRTRASTAPCSLWPRPASRLSSSSRSQPTNSSA